MNIYYWPVNLLFITEFSPKTEKEIFTGGVDARTSLTVKLLKSRHNIEIISRSHRKVFANTISVVPRLIFQIQAFARAFGIKTDLIEGSNFVSYLPAWCAAKMKGVPAVAWYADVYQDVWFEHFAFLPAVTGWIMEKIALKLPWSNVIAMSNSTKNKLLKAGIPEEIISVIYGGVDVEPLRRMKVKKFKKPTICTISRLVNYKHIQDLITAVSHLKQRLPTCQLLIIGSGPEKDNLQVLAQSLNIENNVKFLGILPHEQAMSVLKRCHLLSMTSLVEGFGLVTVEAMAAGIPYVNSRIPATVEITQNGKGGLLFAPKDIADLTHKLRQLLTNTKLYEKKKREGQLLAKRYDWAIIAKQTEAVYKKAIRNN